MDCRLNPNPQNGVVVQGREEEEDICCCFLPLECSTSWKKSHFDKGMDKINDTLTSNKDGLSLNPQIKVVRSRFTTIPIVVTLVLVLTLSCGGHALGPRQTTSNGIFIQMPYSSPPTVRPPPYDESSETCPAINLRENWIDTICGDLNSGFIPANPLGHKFADGSSYPFEIIKNKTLAFFRHALPVLKNDKSLPKVAKFNPYETPLLQTPQRDYRSHRTSRSVPDALPGPIPWTSQQLNSAELKPEARGQMSRIRFCESPASLGGLSYLNRLCKMYNTMWGKAPHHYQHQQRYDTSNELNNIRQQYPSRNPQQLPYEALHQAEPVQQHPISAETNNLPATPCPSSAEYLTPVFARNHEGAWRYVVQIPREGYFTQTVEVTKCAEANCYYMEGSCRTSPRWQSLLVAEMFYPDKAFPLSVPPSGGAEQSTEYQKYQRFLSKRKARDGSGNVNDVTGEQIPPECDGLDEIGCFQVRLFYDWFLIPGSCKCWRKQFDFARVHKSH